MLVKIKLLSDARRRAKRFRITDDISPFTLMRRLGFALIEMILVIGIVGVVGGMAVPLYRDYQIRNDLNLATEQVTQGLARARLLAQSGQDDSGWGFYIPAGVLYKGDSYTDRDSTYDETYPMPSTIMATGLSEVSYARLTGAPSGTGAITLIALNREERTIYIVVEAESIAIVDATDLTICHHTGGSNTNTLTVNEAAWPAHQAHGDTLGACPVTSSAASSIRSSSRSSSSAAVSSAASSAAGGGGGASSATCQDRFSVAADGTITTTGPLSVRFDSLGAQFGYGNGGPNVPVKVSYKKKTNGNSYTNLFSGNAINGNGGATQTVSGFKNNDKVIVRFWAEFSQQGWLSYDRQIISNDGTNAVKVLRNGDTPPTIAGSNGQTSISTLLAPIVVNGKISIGTYDLVLIGDFNRPDCNSCSNNYCSNCTGVDYQDGVVLVKFLTPSC